MIKGNAIASIGRIHEKANRFIVRELESHGIEGIVPSHGGILVFLLSHEACTMRDLAAGIHRTQPTVTVLVDKLVDYGYVVKEKSDIDSRVTYIRLTKKGLTLGPKIEEISGRLNDLVYGDLTATESELLEEMLSKVEKRFSGETPRGRKQTLK